MCGEAKGGHERTLAGFQQRGARKHRSQGSVNCDPMRNNTARPAGQSANHASGSRCVLGNVLSTEKEGKGRDKLAPSIQAPPARLAVAKTNTSPTSNASLVSALDHRLAGDLFTASLTLVLCSPRVFTLRKSEDSTALALAQDKQNPAASGQTTV